MIYEERKLKTLFQTAGFVGIQHTLQFFIRRTTIFDSFYQYT